MIEIWKDAPGYEGKYQVSSFGKIRSLDRVVIHKTGIVHKIKGKMLVPSLNKGYEVFTLKRGKTVQAHRIVAQAFLENVDGKTNIDHIDSNKRNNYYKNLQYVTRSENTKLSFIRGTAAIGSKKNQSPLCEKDIVHIRCERAKGAQLMDLANGYGVSISTISLIVNKKTWKHV